MSEREDNFLGRWARRKAEARGGLQKKQPEGDEIVNKPGRMRTDPPAPKVTASENAAEAETAPEQGEVRHAALREESAEDQPAERMEASGEPEALQEESAGSEPESFDNFDFDSLNYDSDYTRFMKSGVPEAVRKRALRMLWGSNPILANIDGLNDYDEDFTDAALAVKGLLKTSYKAGSGYLTDEEREASYSEEAREHAAREAEKDAEEAVAEDGEEETGGEETELAAEETETGDESGPGGDADDGRAAEKNDKT